LPVKLEKDKRPVPQKGIGPGLEAKFKDLSVLTLRVLGIRLLVS